MIDWLLAGALLLATVAVGVVVHEFLHAAVLRSAGVACSIRLRPGSQEHGGFETLATGSLASVGIDAIPETCPTWRLRAAALAPLVMLLPVGAYAILLTQGYLAETTLGSIVVIAWMGSALPSPADFSIVWHPEETRSLLADEE